MIVTAIKTPRFHPPSDAIEKLLNAIPKLKNGDIVAVSSKVISICEGRCLPAARIDKQLLVEHESDKIFYPEHSNKAGLVLTLTDGVLTESAGVDRSNANGYYILLPKRPYTSAFTLWKALRRRDGIKRLGVIITDSHAIPGKLGAVGMALTAYGFIPVFHTKKRDVFGDSLALGASNIAEGLAAAAVTEMGEGAEQTPVAIIKDVQHIRFNRKPVSLFRAKRYQYVPKERDVYTPLFERHDNA